MRLSAVSLTTLLVGVGPVAGWGDVGHRTVALVARKYLTPEASQYLDELLKNDRGFDFSDAATWADTLKFPRPWTREWHYVDALDSPPTKCGLTYPKDCLEQGPNGCLITAITNQTELFLKPDSSATIKKEAIMFLMHLIGDLHQPLHVENLARGGNDIKVCFGSPCCTANKCAKTNLHSVWDTNIPHKICGIKKSVPNDEEKIAAAEWAEKLFVLNKKRGIIVQSECANIEDPSACSLAWANESNSWICEYVLKEGVEWLETSDLSEEYYVGAIEVVEGLIGVAGARLGGWLNALTAAVAADPQEMNEGEKLDL